MAKTEIRYKHQLSGILAVYFEGEGLTRMRKMEKLVEEKAGVDWLNSGYAKDIIFGTLCGASQDLWPDAVVVSTVVDAFDPLPAFLQLPEQERLRIWEEPNLRAYPQYFKTHDALMAVVQTPERVCLYKQKLLARHGLLIGDPEVRFIPQAEFNGRLKMFGIPPPVEVVEAIAVLRCRPS